MPCGERFYVHLGFLLQSLTKMGVASAGIADAAGDAGALELGALKVRVLSLS